MLADYVNDYPRSKEAEDYSVEAGKVVMLVEKTPQLTVSIKYEQTAATGECADNKAYKQSRVAYVPARERQDKISDKGRGYNYKSVRKNENSSSEAELFQ